MNIIIDANVLFSALIKKSTTRKIILDYEGFFLFPSYIFIEMKKHKEELLRKSGMSKKDFDRLLQLILKKVMIVPNEVLVPYKEEALDIVKDIDPDDVLFMACALAYPGSVIWSDDKKLKEQNKVNVYSTSEIMTMI